MQRSLFALTGAALLVVAFLAGSFMLNGGIPGVHAMGLSDSFSLMYDGNHGHMHGDGDCPFLDEMPDRMMQRGMHSHMHGYTHCPYLGQMPGWMMHRGMGHDQFRGNVNCPHDRGMMHRGTHRSSGHHNRHMTGNNGNCPFGGLN
jgi:hypothetical protein